MKKSFPDFVEKSRRNEPTHKRGDTFGNFLLNLHNGEFLFCVVGDGDVDAWKMCGFSPPSFDHISVSVIAAGKPVDRCPTWEEMCYVKDAFFDAEETVIQYHPPKSQYVNYHKYVLHLWKPIGVEIPIPPKATIA